MLNFQIENPKLEQEFHNILKFFNGNVEKALQDMINLENQRIRANPRKDWKKDFLSVSVWNEENERNISELRKEMRNWKMREF